MQELWKCRRRDQVTQVRGDEGRLRQVGVAVISISSISSPVAVPVCPHSKIQTSSGRKDGTCGTDCQRADAPRTRSTHIDYSTYDNAAAKQLQPNARTQPSFNTPIAYTDEAKSALDLEIHYLQGLAGFDSANFTARERRAYSATSNANEGQRRLHHCTSCESSYWPDFAKCGN